MAPLILVVDDEPKVARLARDYLEKNGFGVVTAADGQSALTIARREKPDLVILDLMLPQIDGREVCRILRRESDVPIIMLTALSEEIDQVTGLEIGADDYITKPFSVRASWRVCGRCCAERAGTSKRQVSSARVDWKSTHRNIWLRFMADPIKLTPNEFKLLVLLASSPSRTLTREQLLDDLHGVASSLDRSVDSHIKNLRKKLEAASAQPLIETVYGVGYRFLEK